MLIAKSGYDEYGKVFPVYFEAFGEYKNPLYIYTTALIYKIFGASEFGLRITSFIYFYFSLFGFYLLIKEMFRNNKVVQIYALLAVGFLPFFFPLSRISFEEVFFKYNYHCRSLFVKFNPLCSLFNF